MPYWSPHDYQLKAVEWIVSRGSAGLMLNPGMGKTSSVLAAITTLKAARLVNKVLVVAPLRVAITVWPVEASKWDDFNHLHVIHLCEMTKPEREAALARRADIYVINPESLKMVLPLLGTDFDMLVVDESTKFKDHSTQRFKVLKPYLPRFKRRVIMTGTPAPNGLMDLFGQVYILDLGERLGRYITHYRQMYFIQEPWNKYAYMPINGAESQIYKRLSDLLLRMDPKDHLTMPDLVNNYISVKLPPETRVAYRQMEEDLITVINEDAVFGVNAAVAGSKCRQITNGFLYNSEQRGAYHVLHSEKLKALEELVEEMQGRPLLILYEYLADRDRIRAQHPTAVDITTAKNLQQTIDSFNAGEIPLLMAHPRSAGHGLNLQGSCDAVCWFGVTWDLELYQQAIARIWRQGNPNPTVVVHHIVAEHTIDQVVLKAIETKDRSQQRLLDTLREYAINAVTT